MKAGADDKRKRMWAIGLGSVAGLLVVYQLYGTFGGGTTSPPPAPPVIVDATPGKVKSAHAGGPAAKQINLTSAQLDPSLHMEPMLVTEGLVYTGSGRNIFSGEMEAPPSPPVEKPLYSGRNDGPQRPVEPPKPLPPPTCPPTCPPINLKFFGTATASNGTKRAFLLNGDDVFLASVGDVVQRKYRVVSIAANSILVEDIPNSNKQTLPLTTAN